MGIAETKKSLKKAKKKDRKAKKDKKDKKKLRKKDKKVKSKEDNEEIRQHDETEEPMKPRANGYQKHPLSSSTPLKLKQEEEDIEIEYEDDDDDEETEWKEDTPEITKAANTPTSSHKKKRKTYSLGAEETVKVSVKKNTESKDPIVVSFPSGMPPSLLPSSINNNISNNTESDVPLFNWFKGGATSTTARLGGKVVLGQDSTCTYTASSNVERYDNRLTKLYVGVFDKKEKKLVVHPAAERGTVFTLEQSVRVERAAGEVSLSTWQDRRNALFESFGSSKKKKVLRSEAANKVDVDNVVGAGSVMVESMKNQEMHSEANAKAMLEGISSPKGKFNAVTQAMEEGRRKFLPPFDANATEPHKVFNVKEIAQDESWNYISRVVDACCHTNDWFGAMTVRDQWTESVKAVLQSVPIDKPTAKTQLKVCLLLHYMVSFHRFFKRKFHPGTADELTKKIRVPIVIANRLFDLFSTPIEERGKPGFAFTKQLTDKRLVYLLLLYNIANGNEMKIASVNEFATDLEIEVRVAQNLLREAGCTVKKNSAGSMSVALKVPLVFPPPKNMRANS